MSGSVTSSVRFTMVSTVSFTIPEVVTQFEEEFTFALAADS